MIHRDGWLQIKTRIDNKGFTAQIKQIENRINDLKSSLEMASKDKSLFSKTEITSMEAEVEKLTSKLNTLKKKELEIDSEGLSNVKDGMKNINSSISTSIKKVGKLALAVFGIRSAYLAVRSAASTLSQYNEQIGTDLEYIKFALATALQPVVEKLISFVYKILGYINMISKALFNVDLFANANVNSFKKANKSAKELKKTLLGFDEINQLQDNKSEDDGGSSLSPSVDLSKTIDEADAEKLKNFWNDVIKFWEEDWEDFFTIQGPWDSFVMGLGLTLKGFYTLFKGIIELIGGIWDILVGLFTGDFDKLSEGWKKLCQGIKDIFLGLIEIIAGLLLTALGFIKGIFLELVNALYNILIKPIVDLVSAGWILAKTKFLLAVAWLNTSIIKPVGNFFVNLWNGIVNGVNSAMQKVKNIFNSVVSFFRNAVSTIVSLFRNIGTRVGDAIGGAFKTVINGILYAIERILNSPIRAVNRMLDTINRIPGINIARLSTFSLPRLASGGIVDIPKTGLNIGSAIVGEAGAEGVLPLTNAETMTRLGQEIAKWITLNLNITNEIDGRVLNKRLETIRGESNFARNGG